MSIVGKMKKYFVKIFKNVNFIHTKVKMMLGSIQILLILIKRF